MNTPERKSKAQMEVQYILIIESGSLDRDTVSQNLQDDGFVVEYANSTEQALEKIIKAKPFLIAIDINVPKLDTRIFSRILKNDDDTKGIKIIAFSDKSIVNSTTAFDSSILTEGKTHLLIKGIRIYLITMKIIISTIIFKNTSYENNY